MSKFKITIEYQGDHENNTHFVAELDGESSFEEVSDTIVAGCKTLGFADSTVNSHFGRDDTGNLLEE